MDFKTSQQEDDAIQAVRDAVKNLPKSIWIETDNDEGELRFWKRVTPSESRQAAPVFKNRSLRG